VADRPVSSVLDHTIDHRTPAAGSDPERDATRRVLFAGICLAILNGIALLAIAIADPALAGRITAVVGAAFVGGRMAGILTGLELGIGSVGTSVIIICLNTGWLLLAFPLFYKVTRQLDPPTILRAVFRGAEARARSHNERLRSLGAFGLVLFVWLPFPFTGAFVGALIVFLMRIPVSRLIPLLLVTMWVGVVTWTLGFEFVFLFTGPAGHIAAWVLTVLFLCYSVVLRFRDDRFEAE
jgi:uncharacterized membrane protein